MAIARSQMYRQLYGIGNLVKREEYGIGSKLKKFVRNIIPNEVAEIAVKAAPFVAPFNPALAAAMSGIGGFDQTGRIGSSLKNAALVYGAGQLARGIGGAGFQGNPFTGVDFSGGFTSGIQSLFTSPMGNVPFGSFSTPTSAPINLTPTQVDLTGAGTSYPDGVVGNFRDIPLDPNIDTFGKGTSYTDDLMKQFPKTTATGPTYGELIKQAGSLDPNVSISQRFDAVKDLSQKALQDIYTKPVRNAAGEIVDRELDKTALISTAVTASTYAEAIGLLGKAGDPNPEKTLSEADYQRLRVDPEKARFSSLKPEAFGIRNLSAEGGIMDDMQSGVLSITLTPANREKFQLGSKGRNTSNNRISQIIQLIRDAESIGDMEKAEELRLDLFRETKKANGGRINYFMGSEIPVRQNQGGVTELDLRNKGGFIPVGIKEKADDVPAMLSKNEFVFTADAVRGAGKGSINKGAQKMYKLMKSLEKKVKKQKVK